MTRPVFTRSERELCAAFIDEFNQQAGWGLLPRDRGLRRAGGL